MALDTIKTLLDRFKHITPPDDSVRKMACEVIKDVVGVSIDKKDVSVNGVDLIIQTKSHIKSEIFIYREKIIKKMEEQLGKKAPHTIR